MRARCSHDLVFSPLCSFVVAKEKHFSTPDRVAGCGNVGLVIVREETKRFVYVRRLIDTDNHDAGLSSFSFYVHQKCNTSSLTAESSGLEIIFRS